MILRLVQTNKDLFAAQFVIKRGSEEVGSVSLKGRLGSREADICGTFYNTDFEMIYGRSKSIIGKPFRPYVLRQGGRETGAVYQAQRKTGLFKKIDFDQMVRQGIVYDLFSAGFGEEGGKSSLYCGEKQIAQIENDCVVYNDLYEHQIYAVDENAGLYAVIFCLYMYVNACYKPGVKVSSSVKKMYSVTKEKYILERCNLHFKENITE